MRDNNEKNNLKKSYKQFGILLKISLIIGIVIISGFIIYYILTPEILQLGSVVTIVIGTALLLGVIMFLIGVAVTKWLAGRRGWDDSFKTALIVNLLWFVVSLIIKICEIMNFIFPSSSWIGSVVILIINIILGLIIVSKVYEKELRESLVFVIIIQIILFIIASIVGLGFILAFALVGLFL